MPVSLSDAGAARPGMKRPARIDAHQHYWRPARGDYRWLQAADAALAPLQRDFLPAELLPQLAAAGVSRTVLVQAADSTAETEYLLSLAAAQPQIGAVVGWVDLSQPVAAETLASWSTGSPLRGIRPMLQDLPDPEWIVRAPSPRVLAAMKQLDLSLDALVRPEQLSGLLTFLRRHPDLRVVIDHAAKPCLAQGWTAGWAQGWRHHVAELARCPGVHCKFSGLLTEMAVGLPRDSRLAALRPVWDLLLETFGPSRLMWGSDWPVLTLVADYADWMGLAETLIGELSPSEQCQIWHDSACDFYRIDEAVAP